MDFCNSNYSEYKHHHQQYGGSHLSGSNGYYPSYNQSQMRYQMHHPGFRSGDEHLSNFGGTTPIPQHFVGGGGFERYGTGFQNHANNGYASPFNNYPKDNYHNGSASDTSNYFQQQQPTNYNAGAQFHAYESYRNVSGNYPYHHYHNQAHLHPQTPVPHPQAHRELYAYNEHYNNSRHLAASYSPYALRDQNLQAQSDNHFASKELMYSPATPDTNPMSNHSEQDSCHSQVNSDERVLSPAFLALHRQCSPANSSSPQAAVASPPETAKATPIEVLPDTQTPLKAEFSEHDEQQSIHPTPSPKPTPSEAQAPSFESKTDSNINNHSLDNQKNNEQQLTLAEHSNSTDFIYNGNGSTKADCANSNRSRKSQREKEKLLKSITSSRKLYDVHPNNNDSFERCSTPFVGMPQHNNNNHMQPNHPFNQRLPPNGPPNGYWYSQPPHHWMMHSSYPRNRRASFYDSQTLPSSLHFGRNLGHHEKHKMNGVYEHESLMPKRTKRKTKSESPARIETKEEVILKNVTPLPGFQQAFGSTEIGRFSEAFFTPESPSPYYNSIESDVESPQPWEYGDSLEGPHINFGAAFQTYGSENGFDSPVGNYFSEVTCNEY